MTNEQELDKKLAEWAGFTQGGKYGWNYPDGSGWTRFLPYFDESLDACFKWLIPKVMKEGYGYVLSDSCGKEPHICTFYCGYKEREERQIASGSGATPALAFCLAIEKLIDSKVLK